MVSLLPSCSFVNSTGRHWRLEHLKSETGAEASMLSLSSLLLRSLSFWCVME